MKSQHPSMKGPLPVSSKEGWGKVSLGDMVDIKNGATPSTGDASYWNGTIPWCTPTDITNTSGKYLYRTGRNITMEGLAQCSAKLLPAGALLLCSRATVGEVRIAKVSLCTNQGFKSLVCKNGIYNEYLYYLVLTLKSKLIERATGSTFLEIGKRDVASLQIQIPTPSEQYAIAKALSDIDELLETLDNLIAKKQAIKWAAMQQLLTGKIRLPGFSSKWAIRKIGELFSIRVGSSKSQYIKGDGNYLIVDMGSIATDGRLIANKSTDYNGDFLMQGDLVMPKDDIGGGKIIGKVAYIDSDDLYVLGDHVYALRLNTGFSKFFSYMINSHGVNSALKRKVGGSAQLGLGRKAVEKQEILVPEAGEQYAIAKVLSDMDTEIIALECRRSKTLAIKHGMMQQLLTGKTRLTEVKET